MKGALARVADGELLAESGITLIGYHRVEAAPVADTIRRSVRRERKWLEQEAGQEPPEPTDLQAVWHMRRIKHGR